MHPSFFSSASLIYLHLIVLLLSSTVQGSNTSTITSLNDASILRRDDFACGADKSCPNDACCAKSGYCGYGPKYCGTDGKSPNDLCWSNCGAHAECGQYAAKPNQTCPLNVCCSEYGFCGTTGDFCGNGCQSGCNQPSSGKTKGDVQKRVLGYYEAWSNGKQCMGMNIRDVPAESLTHVNYAFAFITPDAFDITPMPGTNQNDFASFTSLKERNGALITGISLGGWSFNDNNTATQAVFQDMVSTQDKRTKFINNLIAFMAHWGFDLVDFDWEYPGAPDRQPPNSDTTNDSSNYVALLQELRLAFDSQQGNKYISFTAPTSYWYLRWFDIKAMSQVADYINYMTYDLHGVWDADSSIGNQINAHTNLTEIDEALNLLWRNDVPPEKVNLGMAFYSRTFELKDPACNTTGCPFTAGGQKGACTDTSGILSYREVLDVLTTNNIEPTYDKVAGVKHFTYNTNQWAAYDDQQTFQQKIAYANNLGLGGVMIWAMDQDNSGLDALRGVLYPGQLKDTNRIANDVSYWQNVQPSECYTTACGGSCDPGTIEITWLVCPSDGKKRQKLCCPLSAAPDPTSCTWRGSGACNGQCNGGEVALASSKNGGNGPCTGGGRQFFCCPIPEVQNGRGIDCGWKDKCDDSQTLMTFAGTFLEDVSSSISWAGLDGAALSSVLDSIDVSAEQQYCCSKQEAKNWKSCYWAGTTDKGFDSCDDNHCATGIEVELTTSAFGEGQTCSPKLERQRAFCCTPSSGESLFLPVPLEDLFPIVPPLQDEDPVFKLAVDDTWGTGHAQGGDDPQDAAFGFYVITSPAEVGVSMDKRDGSPWELFDCDNDNGEHERTIRMICTDDSPESKCNDLYLGYGAPGTIMQMPDGCGPGRYAVAKRAAVSDDQNLPSHLRKRSFGTSQVLDLTFDYDFARVPRDFGHSMLRLDFSNEPGYWDSVVNRTADASKVKRDTSTLHSNRKRWLEDEWREAYHRGDLSTEELHKRWFAFDALAWLANLVGIGSLSTSETLHHTVDETLSVILIDQQFGPCPVGPASAQANVKATLDANLHVDTSFGLTVVMTLDSPPDLSNSYLYFKNKGEVTAKFQLDAVASITYNSGDIKLIGLDNFPGATFRIPGIVTVGPNMAVYASADAILTVAGHLESQVKVASWEIEQVYPQTAEYPPKAVTDPNRDGTQALGVPTFDWSVSAHGEISLHLKPTVTFGIVFDDRWEVPKCSVDLILDGYVIVYADAAISSGQDAQACPFTYGVDGGFDLYAQLTAPEMFNWGTGARLSLAGVPRAQLLPNACPGASSSARLAKRDYMSIMGVNETRALQVPESESLIEHYSMAPALNPAVGSIDMHQKRDTFTVGPLLTIPSSWLSCPGSSTNASVVDCPLCSSNGSPEELRRRGDTGGSGDDDVDDGLPLDNDIGIITCPWIPRTDSSCTSSPLSKRATKLTSKKIKLSWWNGDSDYSSYPSCAIDNIQGISKWYMPRPPDPKDNRQKCDSTMLKASRTGDFVSIANVPVEDFEVDHVFEVQLISLFLEWVCGTNKQAAYNANARIPWPPNWGRPDVTWCTAVFGTQTDDDGFLFTLGPNDAIHNSFIGNTATVLGSYQNLDRFAVLLDSMNLMRGILLGGKQPQVWGTGGSTAVMKKIEKDVREVAAIMVYLGFMNAAPAWTRPSNSVEMIAKWFDDAYWTSGRVDPGTPLVRPRTPAGVQNWGLRTLWCYWIDRHLQSIEDNTIAAFLSTSKQILTQTFQLSQSFVTNDMGPNGWASPARVKFPRDTAGRTGPNSVKSPFGMWGANNYGPIGI